MNMRNNVTSGFAGLATLGSGNIDCKNRNNIENAVSSIREPGQVIFHLNRGENARYCIDRLPLVLNDVKTEHTVAVHCIGWMNCQRSGIDLCSGNEVTIWMKHIAGESHFRWL